MDRALGARVKPAHLVCRSGWALLITAACAYFAYTTFSDLRVRDYEWSHDWWHALTWAVWAILAAGLISEVRCWRERILFALVFIEAVLGLLFSLWASAAINDVRTAREIALALWITAVGVSLTTFVRRPGE